MSSSSPKRSSRLRIWLLVVAFLVCATVAAAFITVPVVAWLPGPIYDVIDQVEVGPDVEVYPPTGDHLVLTVAGTNRLSLLEAIGYGISPRADLISLSSVRRPGETAEEYRTRNLQSMDVSVHTSIVVALDRLGYELDDAEIVVSGILEDVPADSDLDPGDVILGVEDTTLQRADDLVEYIAGRQPGDTLKLEIMRDDETIDAKVELTSREDDPSAAMLGITVQEMVDPPLDIDIETDKVGGTSAGLMNAIAIMDLLSPGNMVNGHTVAGTGTLDLDGNVGTIGGIRQKVVAAKEVGAEFVIVPRGNLEEAETASVDIKLVPVDTIDDALDYLAALPPTQAATSPD